MHFEKQEISGERFDVLLRLLVTHATHVKAADSIIVIGSSATFRHKSGKKRKEHKESSRRRNELRSTGRYILHANFGPSIVRVLLLIYPNCYFDNARSVHSHGFCIPIIELGEIQSHSS